MKIAVYRSLREAGPFLRSLAARAEPWTFDIESYDGAQYPSRKPVSTNPHHPDFRVRGCAFALSADSGAWVDFMQDQALLDLVLRSPRDARGLGELRAAFETDAEKAAFNGGFDENGLVYTGWLRSVRNRFRDGMLGMVALGDGTHARLTLTHAVETILRKRMHWEDTDKSLMRDIPIDQVADGAVRDACATHELCDALDALADGEPVKYIEWDKWGQRKYAAKPKGKPKQDAEDPNGEAAGEAVLGEVPGDGGGGEADAVGVSADPEPPDPNFQVEW